MAKEPFNVAAYYGIGSQMMNNDTKLRKSLVQQMYMRVLTTIAISRIKWTGLPDSVDERFMELTLLRRGLVVFFHETHKTGRYLALNATSSGSINPYDNPTEVTVSGNNMGSMRVVTSRRAVEASDGRAMLGVPIWSNELRIPEMDVILLYASRLADFDRTVDINMLQQRKPFIVSVPETRVMTARNVLNQVVDGNYAVFGNDTLDINSMIQALDTRIDKDLVLNGILAKAKIWNECMTLLGINNANQDKKERLVADEVAANDDQIAMVRESLLKPRQRAAEMINDIFPDCNVSVDWGVDRSQGMYVNQYPGGDIDEGAPNAIDEGKDSEE